MASKLEFSNENLTKDEVLKLETENLANGTGLDNPGAYALLCVCDGKKVKSVRYRRFNTDKKDNFLAVILTLEDIPFEITLTCFALRRRRPYQLSEGETKEFSFGNLPTWCADVQTTAKFVEKVKNLVGKTIKVGGVIKCVNTTTEKEFDWRPLNAE